jgi:hypothetical protein
LNKLDLGLSEYSEQLKLKTVADKRYLWGAIRSKWLVLQPEEMVRQLLLLYLQGRGVSKNRIAVERGLLVNGLQKRCDILVYDPEMNPWLLIECKAPQVRLTQDAFRQIAAYNLPLRVPYLLVCNGPDAYCCRLDWEAEEYAFLTELPTYPAS